MKHLKAVRNVMTPACRDLQPSASCVTALIGYLLTSFKLHKKLQDQRDSQNRVNVFDSLLHNLAEQVCLVNLTFIKISGKDIFLLWY